ncbi:cupredoxin domain-containing protein [Raineyella fluvialis]|uniref:Plastocyanin n=1 Tax=Raineyella fluvialis TaxID=2662261 RepID=A0A5Q2FEA6_9ACTN|nr:plastocyanin/azurin family copper-binding protein [Raineyella fluvialis]QGF24711.1 plastocyanin [Raineyella fluvialis]
MEIHTVSFVDATHPLGPFGAPYMVAPTPETTITAPGQFRNSGIMSTDAGGITSYDLQFTGVTGDYHYICYVHGQMMTGIVHVRSAGTPYPYSQQQYNAQANQAKAAALSAGYQLRAKAQATSDSHHVYVGAANDKALVMRFIRPTVRVRAHESVTFDMGMNTGLPVPHTVTFGQEKIGPNGPDFAPYGTPTAYSGGDLSSGMMLPPPYNTFAHVPSTFTVTFTKPGTYHYICMFHDTMGMVGDVIVE